MAELEAAFVWDPKSAEAGGHSLPDPGRHIPIPVAPVILVFSSQPHPPRLCLLLLLPRLHGYDDPTDVDKFVILMRIT